MTRTVAGRTQEVIADDINSMVGSCPDGIVVRIVTPDEIFAWLDSTLRCGAPFQLGGLAYHSNQMPPQLISGEE